MKKLSTFSFLMATAILLQSCAIIRPGEVALNVHFGKIKPGILKPGAHARGIFATRIVRFDTRTVEYSNKLNFHSKEGIEVTSEVTLLYHLIPDSVKSIYLRFDKNYQNAVIINNLITILRQEGLHHSATALITERSAFENEMKEKLHDAIGKYGFVVDLIMLKDIDLPTEVVSTIQAKLNAEQISKKTEIDIEIKRKQLDYDLEQQQKQAELEIIKQRLTLDFAIEKQKKEAERMLIEAEAVKRQQEVINSTLTDKMIRYKSLEITRELVKSNNAKVIVTDGKSPVLLNDDK